MNVLKFVSGHLLHDDQTKHSFESITVEAPDGRTMFAIHLGKDGHSLEIRGVDTTRVDGVLYDCSLSIRPQVSNAITVSVNKYHD